jgi:transmembrane sensor
MADRDQGSGRRETAEAAAARWALRSANGLSATEAAELERWRAADPAHARLLDEYRAVWGRFEPLAAAGAGGARRETTGGGWRRVRGPALAAAACLAIGLWWRGATVRPEPAARVAAADAARLPAPCEQRVLPDGTVVDLNRGAEIAVEFTEGERRVRLVRGEAHFRVAKNPARPFVVAAGAAEAWAVGTAFNVRLDAAAAEVLVTAGLVRVGRVADARAPVLLAPAQLAAVPAGGAGPAVASLTPAEVEGRLAWQPRLLEFDDAALGEIVAEFNRRNPVRLGIDDTALAAQRMTVTFRSDNVESFVRLLESAYGIRVRADADGTIRLSRAPK